MSTEGAAQAARQATADFASSIAEFVPKLRMVGDLSEKFTIYDLPALLRRLHAVEVHAAQIAENARKARQSMIALMIEQIDENGQKLRAEEEQVD